MRRGVRDLVVVATGALVLVGGPVLVDHTIGRGGLQVHGPVVSGEQPWIHGSGGFALDALIGGTLQLSGGCLLLSGDAVVWPSRTRWDASEQVLHLRGGRRAHLGDHLSGGGGSFGGPGDRAFWPTSPAGRATARCQAPGTEVAVFNQTEDITVTASGAG